MPSPKKKPVPQVKQKNPVAANGSNIANGLIVLESHSLQKSEEGPKLWESMKAQNKSYIARPSDIVLNVNDDLPISVSFISDQHIGSPGADYDSMERDAALIRKTPGAAAILAGDSIDNHIRHFAAVLHSKTVPDEQIHMVEHYLDMFGDKIVAILSGNHELWTYNFSGVNIVKKLAAKRNIVHRDHEFRIIMNHNGAEYRFLIRHKYMFNSQLNPTHAHKQLARMTDWFPGPDVITLAHLHEPALEQFWLANSPRWAIRPGSYLVRDAYAETHGFNRSVPTCPTVVIHPGTKKITGFADLGDAMVYLNAARKGR